jgi:hypothetical protein
VAMAMAPSEIDRKKHEENGYLIPDLRLPTEEKQPIGTWGQRHMDYLKKNRKVAYTNLITSGRFGVYLANIDRQVQKRFERLIEDMKQAQGITEQLKAKIIKCTNNFICNNIGYYKKWGNSNLGKLLTSLF